MPPRLGRPERVFFLWLREAVLVNSLRDFFLDILRRIMVFYLLGYGSFPGSVIRVVTFFKKKVSLCLYDNKRI